MFGDQHEILRWEEANESINHGQEGLNHHLSANACEYVPGITDQEISEKNEKIFLRCSCSKKGTVPRVIESGLWLLGWIL